MVVVLIDCFFKVMFDMDQSGVIKGSIRVSMVFFKCFLKWFYVDKNDYDGFNYWFYWDEWVDNVFVCQIVDDLFIFFDILMNVVGVNIGLDVDLMVKFSSIGIKSFVDD